MLDNCADHRHIQEMLSHASILTIQRYTHVIRKKLSEVYEATHPSAEGASGLVLVYESQLSKVLITGNVKMLRLNNYQ